MKPIQSLRGTKDIIGEDARAWERIEDTARAICRSFGYQPVRTPLLEETVLFRQSVGETTDIVQKEMYRFEDRSGLDIALRPEGTASVVRALIEHHLQKEKPVNKFYYYGPMFRAERPQTGRLRQFHQIGAEVFGSASELADVEVIELLVRILEAVGVRDYLVELNNIGEFEDRARFSEKMRNYFRNKKGELCGDCKSRLERNVLRILDCKTAGCQSTISEAPRISEFVSRESRDSFEKVCGLLREIGIDHKVNHRIVRGLDYYTRAVFEIKHPALGSQDAIAAGGRYDKLVQQLGGKDTPAVGFALGMERLILSLKGRKKALRTTQIEDEEAWQSVAIISLGEEAKPKAYRMLSDLRKDGINAFMDFEDRSLKGQMRQADKAGSRFVLILGSHEVKLGSFLLKDMSNGSQTSHPLTAFAQIGRKIKSAIESGTLHA